MSRVLPNAVVVQAFRNLGLPADRLPEDLDKIMDAGLQKLYGFQHEDGSWGWWYDDDSSLYQTAYVIFGLVMTEKAGYLVDDQVLGRGIAATEQMLAQATDPRTKAYALYVLAVAGQGDLPAAQALLAHKGQLDYFAQAALALALFYDGDTYSANLLIDGLIAEAVQTASTAHWPQSDVDGSYNRKAMASTTRATAMVLEALVKMRPQSPLLPKAALWLINKRAGGYWRTTQETAYAILALVDYIQVSGELTPDYTYAIYLNDELLDSGVVTAGNALEPIPGIVVGFEFLAEGENHVRIAKHGAGQLYYDLTLRTRHLSEGFVAVQPAGSGISLTRRYEISNIQYPISDIAVGDLIKVHLTLDVASEAWYVIIDDPIPAGCEALNERLNTTSYTPGSPVYWWRTYGYNRKEVRDDRVTLFVTYLPAGRHEYDYLMRATVAGEFSVMPAEVSLMYEPETWARSASQQVRIDLHEVVIPARLAGDFDRDCRVTDFDLRQVVAAWDTRAGELGYNAGRDLDRDRDVDIVDVVRVADNVGKICSLKALTPTVPSISHPAAQVRPTSRAVLAGETFTVTVVLSETLALGGYEFDLEFNPGLVRADGVTVQPGYTALGPHVVSSQVTCGAFRSGGGITLTQGARLATITFMALSDGEAHFALTDVRAVRSEPAYLVYLPVVLK